MKDPSGIQLLFLAHYAPNNVDDPLPSGIMDVVYAKYHYEIYRILKFLFPSATSSSDPGIMLHLPPHTDFIFSLYNRMPFRNSEIFVSAVAEYYGVPYLGARPNIRALAEDKHLAKMMARSAEIPTPVWKTYNAGSEIYPPDFNAPYFVKPRFGAASEHIDEGSICPTWKLAQKRIVMLHDKKTDVILEKQIKGVYHTSPVLNNFGDHIFLPCIAQYSMLNGGVVTYQQKRKISGGLKRIISEDIILRKQMQHYSGKLFQLVQPLDYTRFDYIIEEDTGIPYFLEFNVCCNLGEHSTVSQAAKHIGIDYQSLIGNIAFSSLYRNGLIDDTFGKKF